MIARDTATMDVEHVTYIFGSFSRRRQSDVVASSKRRSVGQPSSPTQPPVTQRRVRMPEVQCTDDTKDATGARTLCPACQRPFVEPRVLPCLHTFCTPCLQRLEGPEPLEPLKLLDNASSTGGKADGASERSGSGSAGSGYGSEPSWSGGGSVRLLTCPACSAASRLPPGGVTALPPNYILQHRLLLASVNQDTTRLLCDLCSSDMPAGSRCSDCLLNLCALCCEAHRRQRSTAAHEVLPLRQGGVTRVRRQAMCPQHPELELRVFCAPCGQVACRECCAVQHRGHACQPVSRAAVTHTRSVQDALERARPAAEQARRALDRLQLVGQRIQARCDQVQEEVDRFIDSYVAALEQHRRRLLVQVRDATDDKLAAVRAQQRELERRAKDSGAAVHFTEELLAEGSDVEVLSFVSPVLRRLEWCCASGLLESRVSECLQFLPQERAGQLREHALFGLVTTQVASPAHCGLDVDSLMNCRQHKQAEAVLMTRDCEGQPLCHGGEKVTAELRYRDLSNRKLPVHVMDQRDGTYLVTFMPDSPGNLKLSVTVHGKPVQGSPFHICVRTQRPHNGTFHCCSFCSSGGSKDATCGCAGTMPGGYRGCGHGHTGHPGRRHWSCCGNVLENSECGGRSNSAVYQFTL